MNPSRPLQRVVLSVDLACFALEDHQLQLLLVRRAEPPFVDHWALPGAAVQSDEPLDVAASRLLVERTGVWGTYLEQLYTFGDPGRDPRGRTVSVAYYALLSIIAHPRLRVGRGVRELAWSPLNTLPELAFDHARIVAYARWRLAQKLTYSPLPFWILPETFTLGDLRTLYEAVDGTHHDPSNFQKQMLARWDLAPLPGVRDRRTRRPARLYRYIGPRQIAGPPTSPYAPPEES
jgi:8-oxo-dGTP diphosphatase